MGIFTIDPMVFIKFTLVIVAGMTVLSLLTKEKLSHKERILFFSLIAIPILFSTIYLAAHTMHENHVSATGGPIHWHADYQVWVCDERQDLVDPKFPSNKIGTPLFHEHNDDRIHAEGTVRYLEDVDLGSFFYVIGGRISDTSLSYPTVDGQIDVRNGDGCKGATSEVAVYVNGARIENPENYLYAKETIVPPGDCIIIEFGPDLGKTTDRVCESWFAQDWTYDNFEEKRGDVDGS